MKIVLIKDKTVLIDADDIDRVTQYKWQYNPSNGAIERRHHISGSGKTRVRESWNLARFIMNAPKDMQVDHKNHNRLDNRKCNLRLATPSQNIANARRVNKNGYRGIAKHKSGYTAQGSKNGEHFYLGLYKTATEAAQAYNEYAKKTWGEFAILNNIKEKL